MSHYSHICIVVHKKHKILCFSRICWWLVQLLGKCYGCVILNMSMTTLIIGVTRENMISFIHVSCLYSESSLKLQSLSFMILVSHVAADCEETTLVAYQENRQILLLISLLALCCCRVGIYTMLFLSMSDSSSVSIQWWHSCWEGLSD